MRVCVGSGKLCHLYQCETLQSTYLIRLERCFDSFALRKGPLAVGIRPQFPVKEDSTETAQEDVLGAANQ